MATLLRPMMMGAAITTSLFVTAVMAATPLIYEGTLTVSGMAPDPWPRLRFSVVDPAGAVLWSTSIGREGPIEIDPATGRFTAYLDLTGAPQATLSVATERRVAVDVCTAPPNQGECEWLPLDPPQSLGAAPTAMALPSRVPMGSGTIQIVDVGEVRGTQNPDMPGQRDIDILPLDQNARFIIEVLGAHDGLAAYLNARHVIITGHVGDGVILHNSQASLCPTEDPPFCRSWGIRSALGDFDADGNIELRITNQHEAKIENVIVIIRGMGQLLPLP